MPSLAARDFQGWKSDLRSVCGKFDARRPPLGQPFYGEATRHVFGDLEMARIQCNATSITRARHYASSSGPYCFLVLQLSGHQHLCCDGKEPEEIHAGDLILLNPAAPFEMLPHQYIDHFSIHLPYQLIRSQLNHSVFGGKLRQDLASTLMLAALMRQLQGLAPQYQASQAEATALRQSLLSLLLPALHGDKSTGPADESDSELYRVAMHLIDRHMTRSSLTPEWLAEQLRVSRRQLYRAFADEGQAGVAQVILNRRLDRAARLLRDPEWDMQSVSAIAAEVGFDHLAHFSRAFRRRQALAPSHYRIQPGR